jgi:hypothetical protein
MLLNLTGFGRRYWPPNLSGFLEELFVYGRPELEGNAPALLVIASIWQEILFLTARQDQIHAPEPA